MILTLQSPKTVTIRPATAAVTKSISEVEVMNIVDNGVCVAAFVKIDGNPRRIVLWDGAAYDAIGDWTQAQANAKIIALL